MQCLGIVIGSSSSVQWKSIDSSDVGDTIDVGGNGSISSEVVAVMAAVGDGCGLIFECGIFLIHVLSST